MQNFYSHLNKFIDKSRLINDPLMCYAYGTDASVYRMIPKLVILVKNTAEVTQIIKLANQYGVSLTFRAAGTSLSGQAITDQVLVMLENNSWQNHTIHNNGKQISLEPGIIGSYANLLLKPYQTKIGPDPASINHCKIGGIAANNSSGMCCGTAQNSYNTLSGLKLILANGSQLDTSNAESRTEFTKQNPEIITGIAHMYKQIHNNPELVSLIHHKFKIKNTSGYSLNAFIDYHDPIDILAHLMIGSEGTLGFISEITYNCVADNQYKAVSLVYCETLSGLIDLANDINQLPDLLQLQNIIDKTELDIQHVHIKEENHNQPESTKIINNSIANAIELLDITSLLAIKNVTNSSYLPELDVDTSAMLIEVSANTQYELEQKVNYIHAIIDKYKVYFQIKFTQNSKISDELWNLRRGILPIIGGNRPANSSVVIEDIAVPIVDLPSLVHQLRQLFNKYGYNNAAIFGHILAGNIHFVFTPSFNNQVEIDNYKQFMQDMTNLVAIEYKGSLKAEHGCGRNIAPFVELEWGKAAYSIMWQIKHLLDPNNILNPDVILTKNPHLHLQNLKELNQSHPLIDKCIECGFCENVCPSQNLSLTPRGRIATYRYLTRLKDSNRKLYNKLRKTYNYAGIKTCATTSLCVTNCPVAVDTGKFILGLKQQPSSLINKFWANNFKLFVNFNRSLIGIVNFTAKLFGRNNTYKLSVQLHKTIPIIPVYLPTTPDVQASLIASKHKLAEQSNPNVDTTLENSAKPKIVYIPSCNNRIFADTTSNGNKYNAVHRLIEHIGYEVIYPEELDNLCCGQVFSSRGDDANGQTKAQQLANIISSSQLLVLMDNSSCVYNLFQQTDTKPVDIVELVHQNLVKLNLTPKYDKLAVHIDCSSRKIGNQQLVLDILNRCAHELIVPHGVNCCGFAGDQGFTTPELNQAALGTLAAQIKECGIGVSFNRNCQIGLSLHGQKTYLSLAEIVLDCSS